MYSRIRRSRRNGCSRNRRSLVGGTYTAGWGFTGPLVPGAPLDAMARTPITECGNPVLGKLNTGPPGLPGMSGGKRSRRSSRKNNGGPLSLMNTVIAPLNPPGPMVGGRYGFGAEVVGDAGIALGLRPHIPCGEAYPGSPTTPTQAPLPPSQSGGSGGPGGVASMFYNAPTAGYTMVPSDRLGGSSGVLGDGKLPFLASVPYEARTLNQACVKTGGKRTARKNRKSNRKANRKSNRKANRKSRRANRSNRN